MDGEYKRKDYLQSRSSETAPMSDEDASPRYFVSDQTRSDVFVGLCDAERSARCFQQEHRSHVKSSRWTYAPQNAPYLAPLLISILHDQWTALEQPEQFLLATVCVLPLVFKRKDEYKGAVAHFVQQDCGQVAAEMQRLLADIDAESLSDQNARDRFFALSRDLRAATGRAELAKIIISEAKRRKIHSEVVQSLGGTYNE